MPSVSGASVFSPMQERIGHDCLPPGAGPSLPRKGVKIYGGGSFLDTGFSTWMLLEPELQYVLQYAAQSSPTENCSPPLLTPRNVNSAPLRTTVDGLRLSIRDWGSGPDSATN